MHNILSYKRTNEKNNIERYFDTINDNKIYIITTFIGSVYLLTSV